MGRNLGRPWLSVLAAIAPSCAAQADPAGLESAEVEEGCLIRLTERDGDATQITQLEYDQGARLVRWEGDLGTGPGGSDSGEVRTFTWAPDGMAVSWWLHQGDEGEGRLDLAYSSYLVARLPARLIWRDAAGVVVGESAFQSEDGRIVSDELRLGGRLQVARTYEYDDGGRLGRWTVEHFFDEAPGPDLVDEEQLDRDALGRVIRRESYRDGALVDLTAIEVDDLGAPLRAEHADGRVVDLDYAGPDCRAAAAGWRLGWPDPMEP